MSEGYPIIRRFKIRQHPRSVRPWTLTDRSRPRYIEHFNTLADAIAVVDAKLRQERAR